MRVDNKGEKKTPPYEPPKSRKDKRLKTDPLREKKPSSVSTTEIKVKS